VAAPKTFDPSWPVCELPSDEKETAPADDDTERLQMPKISYFYGITITMYWNEDRHGHPHFHARYGEYTASLDLQGEIVAGKLPRRILRLVQDWAELHTEELLANWHRVLNRESLAPIEPLP
jgi:Domain of unknown function (DUF4160)